MLKLIIFTHEVGAEGALVNASTWKWTLVHWQTKTIDLRGLIAVFCATRHPSIHATGWRTGFQRFLMVVTCSSHLTKADCLSEGHLPCSHTPRLHSKHDASTRTQVQAWVVRHFRPWHTHASQKSQIAPWKMQRPRYFLPPSPCTRRHKSGGWQVRGERTIRGGGGKPRVSPSLTRSGRILLRAFFQRQRSNKQRL